MKKYIIVLMACMLLLVGCETEKRESGDTASFIEENDIDGSSDDSTSNYNNTTEAKVEYVTAKEFMEYYSITEDQIPADYVQAYIDDGRITMDDLERDEMEYIKGHLLWSYESGFVYGYNVHSIFRGEKSDEKLSEYMKQAEVILFDFQMLYGEWGYGEMMVIDLRESKIYFDHCWDGEYSEDYIKWKYVAELSEDDIAVIRQELPKHIKKNGGRAPARWDYTIRIRMLAADGTTKYFEGDGGNEKYLPGLDGYWKELYKKYFGKEYEFMPYGPGY